jgi:hypothetical protein
MGGMDVYVSREFRWGRGRTDKVGVVSLGVCEI